MHLGPLLDPAERLQSWRKHADSNCMPLSWDFQKLLSILITCHEGPHRRNSLSPEKDARVVSKSPW